MHPSRRASLNVSRVGARSLLGLLIAALALALGAFAPTASAGPHCDRPNPPPICDPEFEDPPVADPDPDPEPDPVPANSPVGFLDIARETTDERSVRVAGWTADADAPRDPLTVRISIDGAHVRTLTADGQRPDVGAAHPSFGSAHGYDVTIPASADAKQVCVVSVNVGSGGNATRCAQVDQVLEFDANSVSYDTANAEITETKLDQLDKVTNTNQTNVQQSTVISGQKVVTDTRGWSGTVGLKVSVSGGVGIPLIAEGKITVEASASFTWNGSTTEARTFAWQQPVLVPAKSKVIATVAITRSKLVVPFTLSGSYVYGSGHREAGSVPGVYTGINSHDLEVKLAQFNLDGTPAARPVGQPRASLLELG